jgi:hypothetical protein
MYNLWRVGVFFARRQDLQQNRDAFLDQLWVGARDRFALNQLTPA